MSRYTDGAPGDRPTYGEPGRKQRVLNERWPLMAADGRRHAEGIRDQAEPVDVEVRLELETDGEVWLPGRAQRWTRTHVWVTGLADERLAQRFVWVLVEDVRRQASSA